MSDSAPPLPGAHAAPAHRCSTRPSMLLTRVLLTPSGGGRRRKDPPPRVGRDSPGLDAPSPTCSTAMDPPCPATCWSPSGAGKSLFSEYTVRFFKVFGLTLRGGEMTKEETKKKL